MATRRSHSSSGRDKRVVPAQSKQELVITTHNFDLQCLPHQWYSFSSSILEYSILERVIIHNDLHSYFPGRGSIGTTGPVYTRAPRDHKYSLRPIKTLSFGKFMKEKAGAITLIIPSLLIKPILASYTSTPLVTCLLLSPRAITLIVHSLLIYTSLATCLLLSPGVIILIVPSLLL